LPGNPGLSRSDIHGPADQEKSNHMTKDRRARTDGRLSRMLHVLLHMARQDVAFTSDQIAKMLNTNPVLVRRTMAGLREAGYVRSEKGHGGGWTLAKDLSNVSLLDVYKALGGSTIFAIGNINDNPECAVERVVNGAMNDALNEAEALLMERFEAVALSDLAQQFDEICRARGWDGNPHPT